MSAASCPSSTSQSATASTKLRRTAHVHGRRSGRRGIVSSASCSLLSRAGRHRPVGRRLAGVRVVDTDGAGCRQSRELIAVERGRRGCAPSRAAASGAVLAAAACARSIATKRHDARPAGDQLHRLGLRHPWRQTNQRAERPAHLELVAGRAGRRRGRATPRRRRARRRELDARRRRPRRRSSTTGGLVAVRRGQPHVEVLPGGRCPASPARRARCCDARAGGLPLSSRSPCRPSSRRLTRHQYRSSLPRVAVDVVPVLLPEAGLVVVHASRGRAPTWRSSRSRGAERAAAPARRARGRAVRRRTRTRSRPCRRAGPRAERWSCSRRSSAPSRSRRRPRRSRTGCRARRRASACRASSSG